MEVVDHHLTCCVFSMLTKPIFCKAPFLPFSPPALSFSWSLVQIPFLAFLWQIIGFGTALLEEVDPNPANFVGAGIIHTKSFQIGCLMRLEPNLQAQVMASCLLAECFESVEEQNGRDF